MAVTYSCDRCHRRVATEALLNRVALKFADKDGQLKPAITTVIDFCDSCVTIVRGMVSRILQDQPLGEDEKLLPPS